MADLTDLFGEGVEVQSTADIVPIPNDPTVGLADLEGVAKEAAETQVGATADDDLFGDADDDASVATEQLENRDGLTEEELAARRALEYNEDDDYGPRVEIQETTATLVVEKLPVPSSTDGDYWHIKLPSFLRYDEQEFDENHFEEPADDAEDFPEENTLRWRRAASGPHARESNARIVRWSDGSQSLQVGDEFFDVITTMSQVKSETGGKQAQGAGLTLLINQHEAPGMLEAQGAVTGQMTFTPYNISSVAHRRLATTMADKHAKTNRTRKLEVEMDPELERLARERAEADKARAARKERAKAAGPRRKRRGLRSMRIDRSDDEEEDEEEGESGDEGGAGSRPRRSRPSYLDGPDEDDEHFLVESDEEGGAAGGAADVGGEDDLDRFDKAAERTARQQKRRSAAAAVDGSQRMDVDSRREEPPAEPAFVRRKLVVGGDSDDE